VKKDPTALPIYTGIAIIVLISIVLISLGVNIQSAGFKSIISIGIYGVFFYCLLTRKS
jgi:uncharacterized Tic20 family protein